MQTHTKKMETKIIALKETFGEYGDKDVMALGADWFVHYYYYESWEGSGFAVWRKGEDFFYTSLGHCSCYGPTENLNTANGMSCTWEQIKQVSENYPWEKGSEVVKYIEENNLHV